MTDPQLIQLVRDKAPQELSVEDLGLLRSRLRHSAEVRAALVDQLQMEEYLTVALGRVAVSADDIYARAAAQPGGSGRVLALFGWSASLGLGIIVLVALILWPRERPAFMARSSRVGGDSLESSPAAGGRRSPSVQPQLRPSEAQTVDDPGGAMPQERPVEDASSAIAATGQESLQAADTPAPAKKAAPREATDVALSTADWPELDPKQTRRPFLEAAFDDGDGAPKGLSKGQFSRWFAPVPGQPHNFTEANRGNVVVSGFEGIVRLRAPWPADAVLTLTPFETQSLAVYFWARQEGAEQSREARRGVALFLYQHPRPNWAAYIVTRKGAEPRPATFALAATDNDRYERTLAGTIDIRHQDGSLVVSRGDVRLFSVPLESPPSEVYFDRHAWFRTFTMSRGQKCPDEPAARQPSIFGDVRPAALAWTEQLAKGTAFATPGAGAMQLTCDKQADLSRAAVKVPRTGLYEIIFRLADLSPGTGVYLGDDAGKPLYVVGVLRDQPTGLPVLSWLRPDAGSFDTQVNLTSQVAPLVAPGQWLKLVAGSGTLKCWVSSDGRSWSRALEPLRGQRGAWSHVGLIGFKTNDARRIVVDELRVCELPAIAALADGKLAAQVPASVISGDPQLPAWESRVTESLPGGTDGKAWRSACALRTLGSVPPAALGNALLNGLIEANIDRDAPVADRLLALNQAAELYDAWDQPDSYRLSQYYERLGRRLLREGDHQPWSKVGRFLPTAPICTNALFQTLPDSLAAAELLYRIYDDQWSDVRQLCRRLKFLNRPAPPEQGWPDHRPRTKLLVEWADATAQRLLSDGRRTGDAGTPLPVQWQHPLVAHLSREGYNTLADLEATLAEQSYREACQVIQSVRPELALGLLPDGRDPKLLISLPQAVETAMRDSSGLKQTMIEQFGTLGRLRLQQALADGDPRMLEALAVQFFGTTSAATAHQWLGDRALGDGDFARAAAEFERALHNADAEQKPAIAARLRLAAAMLGRDEGQPVRQPVVFNDVRLSPVAFEKLISEMKQHAVSAGEAPLVAAEDARPSAVKPVRYDVQSRGALRGDTGQNPGNPGSGEVDWAARQWGWTTAGRMLFLSNRFQVTAVNMATGKHHWSVPLGKDPAGAHSWPLIPMRPVATGDRVFVRRIPKSGPELSCFHPVTSKVRWTTTGQVQIASDPLLLQDRLYVFSVSAALDDGLLLLELSQVDPQTGGILTRQPVIQLRDLWDRQLDCRATVVGARLVAIVGGTVLCCDFGGRPLWVRRQMWIPPSRALAASEQSFSTPLVHGNRLFATQPGVFAVECLDLDTGRRLWQQPIHDIRRLIGISGERLIVETARGWQAHAADTGKPLWQHDAEQLLDAQVCPTAGDLLVAQRERHGNDAWHPVLVWLSPETGRETARSPLESLADKEPLLGPLIVDHDHLWALFGRTNRDPHRELVELTPTANPADPPHVAAARRANSQ